MEETKEEATEHSSEGTKNEPTAKEESRQGKTWYPYITKSQFDKFLARLDSKMPEQIDRDYIRAITTEELTTYFKEVEPCEGTVQIKPMEEVLKSG